MEDDEDDPSTWDLLPYDAAAALSAVLDTLAMPPRALALYARWWQLENWLRSLAYVELRSRDGLDWSSNLGAQAHNRQQKDKQYAYMASPDWDDPLTYLDASKLLELIDRNWELFGSVLPGQEVWLARKAELLSIRNRIGHLRRPHRDDLRKLEQTLRDLEHGAVRAVTSYNHWWDIDRLCHDDPVIVAHKRDQYPDAGGLREHAELRRNISLRLSYTVRPWANHPKQGMPASSQPGILWNVGFYAQARNVDVPRLWRDLSPFTRQLLVHLLVEDTAHVVITLPAVDDSELVATAIGDVLKSVMHCTRPISLDELKNAAKSNPVRRPSPLDSRVQVGTAWSFVDESMTPISLFGAY